jgi:hypothetical protein
MPPVKCRDCGFLAIRDPFSPNSTMTEAYELVRNQGWQNASSGKRTIARLYCYANQKTFANPLVDQPKKIVAEIGQEIECDAFRLWHPGKSPEKHEEMTILERVREENRQAQERAEGLADKHHAETLAEARRYRLQNIAISLLAALAAFASVALSLWALLKK